MIANCLIIKSSFILFDAIIFCVLEISGAPDSKTPKNKALAACDAAISKELDSPIEGSALTTSIRKKDNVTLVTRGFTYADGRGSVICRVSEEGVEMMLELE